MLKNIRVRTLTAIILSFIIVVATRSFFESRTLPDFSFVGKIFTFKRQSDQKPTAPNRVSMKFVKPFPKIMRPTLTGTFATPTTATNYAVQTITTATLTPGVEKVPSKLGVFLLSTYSPGAKAIIQNKPKIIKVMDPQSTPALMSAVREYKNINPKGVVILRVYENTLAKKYTLDDDAQGAAANFFSTVIQPAINRMGNDLSLFDYIETPNELDNTPGWDSTETAAWLGRFWSELVTLNIQYGLKTCVGSIPVGNPPGEASEVEDKFRAFLPALTAAKQHNGALCYHAYTLDYSTDPANEIYYSLRYRLIHKYLIAVDASLSSLPFILSEGGVDRSGDPQSSGWQTRGDANQYTNWLSWLDSEIAKDDFVIGVTLFQIGDGQWSSFDLEPVASWIAGHIAP